MADFSQEQIDQRFDELPVPLQDALFDPDALSRIISVASRLKLSEDNQDILLFIFGQMVMGFISLDQMSASITAETGLPMSLAKTLADEIRHDILDRLNLTKLISPSAQTKPIPPVPTANILNLKRAPAASIPPSSRSSLLIRPPTPNMPTGKTAMSGTPTGFLTPISPRPLPKPLEQVSRPATSAVPGTPTPPTGGSVGATTPFTSPTPPPVIPAAPGPVAPIRRDFLRTTTPNTATPPLPTGSAGAAPFVLHRESEVKPITRLPLSSSSAVSRIEHSDTPSPTQQSAARAKVEIGQTVRAKRREELIRPTRTSPSQSHPIDYSALSAATPRDPFSGTKTPSPLGSSVPNPPLSFQPSVPPPPKPPSGPRLVGHTVDLRQKN